MMPMSSPDPKDHGELSLLLQLVRRDFCEAASLAACAPTVKWQVEVLMSDSGVNGLAAGRRVNVVV